MNLIDHYFKWAFNGEIDNFLAACLDEYSLELDKYRFGERSDDEFDIQYALS